MAKIDFLKKGLAGSEEEKSEDLADANKEIYKKKKEIFHIDSFITIIS